MEVLLASQASLHGRIARSCDNLRKTDVSKVALSHVRAALTVLEAKWVKVEAQHDQLLAEFGKELAAHEYVTKDFVSQVETTYIQQRAQLLEWEEKLTVTASDEGSKTKAVEPAAQRNALPKIQLPQFSGKFEDWPAFRDLFDSLVLSSATLPKVEKLHYLKTCVKGDAEQLVRNLPTTAENFDRPWKTLTAHFENKRLLVRAYLSGFTALPKMKSDSATDLRRIFHSVLSTVGALEGIGRPISNGTDLFVHLVVELLDHKTRREWESTVGDSSDSPSYEELRDFLQKQLMTQEALRCAKGDVSCRNSEKSGRTSHSARGQVLDASRSCPLCRGSHFLGFCGQYKKKTAQERRELVATHQRCWNCLGRHLVGECPSTKSCSRCSGRHHTTLHESFVVVSAPPADTSSAPTVHVAERPQAEYAAVLLATARVLVTDRCGTQHPVRVLIDPGSETSLMAESLAQRLRVPRTPSSVAIFGVGGIQAGCSRGRVSVTVSSRTGTCRLAVSALVLPRLTCYGGAATSSVPCWPHINGLELADPEFLSADPVELLLGAEAYASIALPTLRRGGSQEPIAQQTRLGWILLGAMGSEPSSERISSLQCSTDQLTEAVRRFWEWEEPPSVAAPLSVDDQWCEDHFTRTHSRLADGRYQVRLPFRSELPDLSHTRRAAERLLGVMTRRFERDPVFQERYKNFLAEYEALGHMVRAEQRPGGTSTRLCYLPHHGVMKGEGSSAKIRVVFNGSSRPASGRSLNEALHTGPNLLPHLADVLMRWRRHRYVFIADIEKMYRQIEVHPDDWDLQRILWRVGDQLVIFLLRTVTYGLACAAFLAIRSLRQLAVDEGKRYPRGANTLCRDTYMDDVLAGEAELESTLDLRRQVASLCMAGGFPLKKWAANHPEILADVPADHRLHPTADASLPTDDHAVLGIRWSPAGDEFCLSVQVTPNSAATKRTILSQSARLFDPMGWLAPVVVRAKLLIQTAWLQNLEWDAPLAEPEATTWRGLLEELPLLSQIRIPRWLQIDVPGNRVELHGFADALERAYAAAIYLRVTGDSGRRSYLLVAKTKVAPLKRVSLPRLELCAAALLSRVSAHVRDALGIDLAAVHHWTDSTVALGWIRGHPARWTTFVANRVAEIQRESSKVHWRHVPGGANPADCASRGLSPGELLTHPLWWRGPSFLMDEESGWPMAPGLLPAEDLPEGRAIRCLVAAEPREPEELTGFLELRRLLHVTAWIYRWRWRNDEARREGHPRVLKPAELNAALTRWIRVAQETHFPDELESARNSRAMPIRSMLRKLTSFLDDKGLLRVGGRLRHSVLSHDQRHPIILPPESHLTRLVIEDSHLRLLHGGTQATLARLRTRYWIPRGRQLVRRMIHRCLPCLRWRGASPQPLMGDLPESKVTPSRPFQSCGVDYAAQWANSRKTRTKMEKVKFGILTLVPRNPV